MVGKNRKVKLVAWVLTIAMVLSLIIVPAGKVAAEEGSLSYFGTERQYSSGVIASFKSCEPGTGWSQFELNLENNTGKTVCDWIIKLTVPEGAADVFKCWSATCITSGNTIYLYPEKEGKNAVLQPGALSGYYPGGGFSRNITQSDITIDVVYFNEGSSAAYDYSKGETKDPTGGTGGNETVDDYTGSLVYDLPAEYTDDAETTPFAEHGKLHVDMTTKKLTDQYGNPFQLRGLSTHGINWDSVGYPYVNFNSFKNARDIMNANAIRLAMYTTEYYGYADKGSCEEKTQDYVQKDLKYRVDKGVKCATALGMYAIVDWHVLQDKNPQKYKSAAKEYFAYVSELYKDYDNILYEICNEPNDGTSWADIKSYAEEIIPIIRANDPDAIIIVGTPTWSQEVDKPAAAPITDSKGSLMDNVMYTIHFYADTHGSTYRDVVKNAEGQIPIFCTEFGMCNSLGAGTNNFLEATDWLDYFDQACISYFVWSMSIKETASLFISGGGNNWTADNLSESGQWIKEQYTARKSTNNVSATTTDVKRDITVTADNKEKFYGDSNPEFTYTITAGSLVDMDTLTGITFDTVAMETSDVGEYDITVTAAKNAKYNITTIPGKLTINKKPITGVEAPSGSTIKTSQTLSESTLSGGGSIYGTYAWSNPTATPERGSYTSEVILTLSEKVKKNYSFDGVVGYNPVTGTITQSVTITVMRGDLPSITFPVATEPVQYGQKLSDVVLDSSSASTNLGTFEWENPNDVLTNVGKNDCAMIFKWNDAAKADYGILEDDIEATLKENVSVTVDKQENLLSADVPQLVSRSAAGITVKSISGVEFSLDKDNWNKKSVNGVFTGLDSYTEYAVYSRYAETATKKAGVASEPLSVCTLVASPYTIDVSKLSGTEAERYVDALRESDMAEPTVQYDSTKKELTLTQAGKNYTITGDYPDLNVKVSTGVGTVTWEDANIAGVKREEETTPSSGTESGEETNPSGGTENGEQSGENPNEQPSATKPETGTAPGSSDPGTGTMPENQSPDSGTTPGKPSTGEGTDYDKLNIAVMQLMAKVKNASNVPINGTYKLAVKKKLQLVVNVFYVEKPAIYAKASSSASANGVNLGMTFESSNPAVASIDDTGKITAKKKGATTITVTLANGMTKSFRLQVMKKSVSKIKITGAKTSMKVKGTMKLKAVTSPGKKVASNNVYWKSSNTKVAAVDAKGKVKALKKGTVKLTAVATDGSGKKATVKIKVK